ncbi:MAG: 23S rRNA (uracil(1939)-C(5))-methyltransferase RlmD [Pseudomonadota bacterium]
MASPPQEGQILEVEISALAYGGDGIARPDGFTLFIPRTVPGDRVRVEVQTVRKRYARAVPLEILERSSLRIEPNCRYFDECGGCHYQNLDPDYVAEQKVTQIRETLARIGKVEANVLPIVRPDTVWNYRNRLTYHRSPTGASGYVSWRDYRIVDVEECPIAQPELNTLWKEVRTATRDIPGNVLPFVVLRKFSTGHLGVIYSATGTLPSAQLLEPRVASDDSICVTSIKVGARSAFGDTIEVLRGPERLTERFGGIDYVVRPDLFFQVHPEVTERVVERVGAWAEEIKPARVIDLYCGAGLFTLAFAKRGFPTVGVEVTRESILCAEESARVNGLEGTVRFRGGKAERITERLIREGERFDAAVVDPPRKGLPPELIDKLPRLGVTRLLYVSCSPPTLARDVAVLSTLGYRLVSVQPFDMFPQTYHVETISTFSR